LIGSYGKETTSKKEDKRSYLAFDPNKATMKATEVVFLFAGELNHNSDR
jgi:hypothetical protein